MPNRILREGILTSEPVNSLTPPAELFYRRLISVVDDYGRYHASPRILRSACYPLQVDRVREADISRWIAECEKAGLIVLYNSGGTPYLIVLKTDAPRAKTSKYPEPPASARTCWRVRPDSDSDANPNAQSPPPPPQAGGSSGVGGLAGKNGGGRRHRETRQEREDRKKREFINRIEAIS